MLKLNKKHQIFLKVIAGSLTFLSVISHTNAEERNFTLGFSVGYSFFSPGRYTESISLEGKSASEYKLGIRGGIYLQIDISRFLALQIEICKQRTEYFHEYLDFKSGDCWSHHDDETYNSFMVNFQHKIYFKKDKRGMLYLLAGFGKEKEPALTSKIGIGGKFPLFKQTNLNLSLSLFPGVIYWDSLSGIKLFPFVYKNSNYLSLSLSSSIEYKF